MRIGFNPEKNKVLDVNNYYHQVIIPVYIPNEVEYYKESISILKYCLASLFKTIHAKTFISIVNNGSCIKVVDYLDTLLKEGKINELIHTNNIGKINSIIKGLAGQEFPLVTISDADVLFLNNWQKETYNVFNCFPKCGVVSPVPNSKLLRYYTSNVMYEKIWSKSLFFTKVKNPEAMQKFAESISNSGLFNKVHLNKYLTLSKNEFRAVIGAGHFVATYRNDVLNEMKKSYSKQKMGNSMEPFLDRPTVKNGYWRLSTEDNYAYHMGNTMENWMKNIVDELKQSEDEFDYNANKILNINTPFYNFKIKWFSKLIFRNYFWKLFLKKKGLEKNEINSY